MAKPSTIVLSSGGLRSLVASVQAAGGARLTLLFVRDGRPAQPWQHASFERQAAAIPDARSYELVLPHLRADEAANTEPLSRWAPVELLTAAVGVAGRFKADRIVWPVQAGGDFEALARITETAVLVGHLAQAAIGRDLRVDTPLAELSDTQIVELGQQLRVPWEIARSCRAADQDPCRTCAGCRWRAGAFARAGIEDPLDTTPVA